jgi:hypothetical protein
MKQKLLFISIALLIVVSCTKKLTENPYTVFSVSYLKTSAGIQNAVNDLYSNMRFEYGPEGTNGLTCDGTDEWTYGDQPRTGVGGTADYLTLGTYTLDPTNGAIQTPWNRNFSSINLANGVITWAPTVTGIDTGNIIAQARFLRGLYYLLLVEEFGAVPLDLGSGPLQFNSNAFQGFNRLPVDSVEAEDFQAMITDFTYASQNLPVTRPANAFVLSQAAAYLMLSRVYMFRAYSAFKQSTDFTSAYQAAIQVVNNAASFGTGLLQDYGQVVARGNDYNQEILYSVERIPGDLNDNEATSGQIGGGKENDANNDFNADYTSVQSPTPTSGVKPVSTRTTLYGRPLRRFCPTAWMFNTAFADKFNDSRYNNTFRTVFLCSTAGGGFNIGDTGFILANTNAQADSMNAIPKKYRVVAPREFYVIGGGYAQNIYPTLSKYSDSLKAIPNDPGGRPYPVCKLSECYLLAAEAAMQGGSAGGTTEAAQLINVLRTRAAYRPGLLPSDLAARVLANQISPAQITLDFIMDERTRELAGESIRWPDLAMRGILLERVLADNPDAAPKIQPYHVLRPIPQSQLDATDVANKAAYQNPGYN